MCHIRDFTDICLTRARLILETDEPLLPSLDPHEASQRRDYAHQELAAEFAAYLASRRALVTLLTEVSGEQWQLRGIHSTLGSLSLLELVVFITLHDVDHIEQIARTLGLSEVLL